MYQKILLSCLSILFLFGCKKEDPKVIVDIDDDFYVDMFEDRSNGDQRFQLNLQTIQEQTCINFEIDYDLDFNEQTNSIELTINDVVEPEDCAQGTAFASVEVPFGRLSEGSYSFDINLKDAVINNGRLSVLSDRYELVMNSNDGIEVLNDRLYRIPENTIWGYVAFDEGLTATEANNFITDLENLNSVESVNNNNTYRSGYYGYFNLDDEKSVLISPEIETINHYSFIFHYDDENLEAIEQLINTTCDTSSEDLKVYVFSETGQTMICP